MVKKASGPATLAGLITQLNQQFGADTVVLGSQISLPARITSGSLALDVILGGGWPVNQWVEIIGEPSAGKTAVVLMTLAANQRADPNWKVWWLASEHFDPGYAALCGCDLSRIVVHDTNITEDGLQAVLGVAGTREIDAIVIDSLPALTPSAEDDKGMEEWTQGLAARQNNKFFRKQGVVTKRSLTSTDRPLTGFIINQYREKIGVMYGDPRTTPGGKGKDFAYYVRIEVKRDDFIEVDGEPVGQVLKVVTKKNKSHRPHREAVFDFYFAEGAAGHTAGSYDTLKEIVDVAIAYGVVEQRGGGMFDYRDRSFKGRATITAEIRDNEDLRRLIVRDVLAATAGIIEEPAVVEPKSSRPLKVARILKRPA